MSALSAPIAFVDEDRQIVVVDRDGRFHPLTRDADHPGLWDVWARSASDQVGWVDTDRIHPPRPAADADERGSTYSWPTWSPDGRRLACFRFGRDDEGAATAFVHVLDVDGVSAAELVNLDTRLPIYLQWSADGRYLGVLSQRDDRLMLSVARPDSPGIDTKIADGSPLFFTWTAVGTTMRLAAFVGTATGGHLGIYDPRKLAATVILPGLPGNFCTPIAADGKILYVAWLEGRTAVVMASAGAAEAEPIETVDGLVALVPGPGGKLIARAIAPGGDGTPYRQLAILDVETREVRPLLDRPMLAFLWMPDGKALLVAHVDTERNLLVWTRVPLEGPEVQLLEMFPSRDLGFYLRFFEQYSESHPIVSPDGRYLLLAGVIPGRDDDRSRIWQVRTDDGRVDPISDGLFAVYGPTG